MRTITIALLTLALMPAFAVSAETPEEGSNHAHEEKPPSHTLDLSRWGRGIYYLDGMTLWEETNKVESLQRQPFIVYAKAFPADTRILS